MLEQAFTLAPQPGYRLSMTAKRYWLPAFEAHTDDPDALTLVFLHATSFHKETWEPTVERLFELAQGGGGGGRAPPLKIREAWAVECPNHGQSAVLNERALQQPEFLLNFTCEKYARGVHHFLSAGPDAGACVDFRKRNLVGVGHSLGGVAMTILQQLEPGLPFRVMILIEPMLSPAGPQYFYDLRRTLLKKAYERRDGWPDREHALMALKTRRRTSRWDPRILDLYVKYALRPHPGSYYPEVPYHGVTLACTRDQEAAMYRDEEGPTKPVAALNIACSQIPVHIILGEINDIISRKVHNALINPMSGRHYASITRLSNVGHLVPQQEPDLLAKTLFNALTQDAPPRSKL